MIIISIGCKYLLELRIEGRMAMSVIGGRKRKEKRK
jgi:hypothetical protein